ncbi:MAG: amidase domain-containing protein [Clostridia bacterium]|nr:amidase domain-containing protein [Clostridia bacterium]
MRVKEYNRKLVVSYAQKWAYKRNKKYYNFDKIGGDCTNFASQCIYAGSKKMNYGKSGWYYNSINDRAPSWTGVEFLYNFLVNNTAVGPFAKEVSQNEIQVGDIIQLSFDGNSYAHNLVVVDLENDIKVAAHTFDVYGKSLFAYRFNKARFIHIEGVRV